MAFVMKILDPQAGDTSISWDPDKPNEVENAQATFDDLRAKGYRAYRLTKDGGKGETVSKFNKSDERLLLAPPLAGG